MATLGSDSPPSSPSGFRRRRGFARRCERCCCNTIMYFPLLFVYALTTWAVWVEAGIRFGPGASAWIGYATSTLGIALYTLLNVSYTTAVFTNPGSPSDSESGRKHHGYSHLPTHEQQQGYTSFTVKSTGDIRFCKKCRTKKPDRAHHCSSCKRCVLKMDHHCPWLATCVGLRNYKPFLLFLIYTSLFCWACFAVSAAWLWTEIISDGQFAEALMPVQYVLLAVISGIIGLVLTGFTAWHIYLACRGQTTIESLEKIRYLRPVRDSMGQQLANRNYVEGRRPSFGEQLREIHANALPGITRPEEGEERTSPAQSSLRNNWADIERQRESDRYQQYLDEKDDEKLPNAFDLGWRRNLRHVLGETPLLWFLPICNTTGDGWQWEASPKWLSARDQIAKDRETRLAQAQAAWHAQEGSGAPPYGAHGHGSPTPIGDRRPQNGYMPGNHAAQSFTPSTNAMPMKVLDRRRTSSSDDYSSSSDDDDDDDDERPDQRELVRKGRPGDTANWNDIPDDFVSGSRRSAAARGSSRNRRKADEWQQWGPG